MDKLRKFIEEVEMVGSVFDYGNGPMDMSDWDDLFRRFAAMGIKGEIVYYCSPQLLDETVSLLKEINAGYKGCMSHGIFNQKEFTALSFLSDMSFKRGSYEIFVIAKQMDSGVLIPYTDSTGEIELAKSAIKIQTNGN